MYKKVNPVKNLPILKWKLERVLIRTLQAVILQLPQLHYQQKY